MLILLAIPIVWSLPETLIVAELASMLPEEGGYYRWVHRAFGPFWAFQNGWWTWVYSLVDMAIYPVLFNQYLAFFVPGLGVVGRWGVSLAMIWGATAINLRGASPVGRTSVVSGLFVMAGFLALVLAALPHAHHAPWSPWLAPGKTPLGALGVGLSYALANAAFGGSAEYVALWFKSVGHEPYFYYYVTALCAVALLAALWMPDTISTGVARKRSGTNTAAVNEATATPKLIDICWMVLAMLLPMLVSRSPRSA